MADKKREQPKTRKSRIPTFKTIEEEAAFWDTHSSEEFADELTPVENVEFVKARFDAGAQAKRRVCPDVTGDSSLRSE